MKTRYLSFAAIAICTGTALIAQQPSAPRSIPQPLHFGAWGVDLSAMDRSVPPGNDFDRYVNGAWADKTSIPADQSSAGVTSDLFNLTQEQIRALIENAPATTQLGAMYQSFMNEPLVETLDDKPLQTDLKLVAALADRDAFTTFMGQTNGRF